VIETGRPVLIRAGQYLAGFLFFLLIWWGGTLLVGSAALPGPVPVFVYIKTAGVLTDFFCELGLTIARGVSGFSFAMLTAIPIGVLMGRKRGNARLGFFPFLMLQSAPPLFWITPLVLWLGTRGPVPLVVSFLVSLPLLTFHTMHAIAHIPPWEYEVFAVYAPRRRVIAGELYLPHLLPALKSNIHLGILVSVKAAMLAEWFASRNGFGRVVRIHYQYFAMVEFVAWAFMFLVVVGGLSFGLEMVIKKKLPLFRPTPLPGVAERIVGKKMAEHKTGEMEFGLAVSGLSFGYNKIPLFEGLSFRCREGRAAVLYGPSGCGKTSLLKCIAGIQKPWEGSCQTADPCGLVFQDDALLTHRDALGNVLLPVLPQIDREKVDAARSALALWGLEGRENAFPHELSGGMRKRLAMARAWFLSPRLLLLDEPFVNLDKEARQSLWNLFFLRLQESSMTALIVTHYREELAHFDTDFFSWEGLT
jgi:NitT/TauT family transport system ATP-binding protein